MFAWAALNWKSTAAAKIASSSAAPPAPQPLQPVADGRGGSLASQRRPSEIRDTGGGGRAPCRAATMTTAAAARDGAIAEGNEAPKSDAPQLFASSAVRAALGNGPQAFANFSTRAARLQNQQNLAPEALCERVPSVFDCSGAVRRRKYPFGHHNGTDKLHGSEGM